MSNSRCFVYVLELSSGRHYTGITNNIVKRIKEHHQKKSKYTSRFEIISLKYLAFLENRKTARKLEVKIKNIGAKKYFNNAKFADRHYLDIPLKILLNQDEEKTQINQFIAIRGMYKKLE